MASSGEFPSFEELQTYLNNQIYSSDHSKNRSFIEDHQDEINGIAQAFANQSVTDTELAEAAIELKVHHVMTELRIKEKRDQKEKKPRSLQEEEEDELASCVDSYVRALLSILNQSG